jgi:uncharacterized protein (DUF2147 family)
MIYRCRGEARFQDLQKTIESCAFAFVHSESFYDLGIAYTFSLQREAAEARGLWKGGQGTIHSFTAALSSKGNYSKVTNEGTLPALLPRRQL